MQSLTRTSVTMHLLALVVLLRARGHLHILLGEHAHDARGKFVVDYRAGVQAREGDVLRRLGVVQSVDLEHVKLFKGSKCLYTEIASVEEHKDERNNSGIPQGRPLRSAACLGVTLTHPVERYRKVKRNRKETHVSPDSDKRGIHTQRTVSHVGRCCDSFEYAV
ncbi:hypothetical protein CVT25_010100 [Psilocybe cyanescens]|uniref:Secreted protein n=1 Tax=Psilocybe cyanescens TaxID=93625 RepID=A0A409X394_PSICY|nr:hypothetical protein CVT25_010100 [Psilocybe cyanescens]